jgi:PST family polysaccharide transporter
MEKVKYLSFLMLISKSLYIVSIFIFVNNPEDYFYVPLLNGITAILSGLLSISIIIFKFKVYPVYLKSIEIINYIKNNWNIFLSILAINLYRNSNVLILGFIVSESIVGIYSGGEKIVIAIQSIFAPITQVIYPYISRLKTEDPLKSKNALILLTTFIGLGTIFISLLLFFFADEIALLVLGAQFIQSGNVIRISSFVVFFGTLNFIMGIIFMTNYGMKKEFTKAVVFTGFINVFLCFILSYIWQEIGTAFSFLSAELILTFLLLYFINQRYKNILKIIFNRKDGYSNA